MKSQSELSELASERRLRIYGEHYLYPFAWKLQKRSPGIECGNCASSSMTSACWCGWETIAVGEDEIRSYLATHD